MKKKIIYALVVLLAAASLCGCGKKKDAASTVEAVVKEITEKIEKITDDILEALPEKAGDLTGFVMDKIEELKEKYKDNPDFLEDKLKELLSLVKEKGGDVKAYLEKLVND